VSINPVSLKLLRLARLAGSIEVCCHPFKALDPLLDARLQ
jgi:hypothetical protein